MINKTDLSQQGKTKHAEYPGFYGILLFGWKSEIPAREASDPCQIGDVINAAGKRNSKPRLSGPRLQWRERGAAKCTEL